MKTDRNFDIKSILADLSDYEKLCLYEFLLDLRAKREDEGGSDGAKLT